MKNILVLYSEVMGYNLGCFRELVKRGYHVHCIHWDLKKNTPYVPSNEKGISFHKRSNFDLGQMETFTKELNPSLILVSGWMDKGYLKICKIYKKTIPIISGLDNWWKGNPKQLLACLLSFILVKPYFSHLFVPGKFQYKFAKMLGFNQKAILKGLYTCNDSLFRKEPSIEKKSDKKIFLFIGRYVEIKGILAFTQAFHEISYQLENCELHLYGNGELKEKLLSIKNEQIFVNDFVDPDRLKEIYDKASVFCLPSLHEPWGLVIHEAVCAGLPLLVSNKIGACSELLEEGLNGLSFEPNNIDSIKNAIHSFNSLSIEKLKQYSNHSRMLSDKFSTIKWADELLSTLNNPIS